MNDPVTCDTCGKAGPRHRGRIAPEGWFYLEFRDDTSGEDLYVYACSKKCQKLEWKAGPGSLGPMDMDQQYLDVVVHKNGKEFEHTIEIAPGDLVCLGQIRYPVSRAEEGHLFLKEQ